MSAVATDSPASLRERDLAVAWMNRGHALVLQGGDPGLTAALEAYNEAVSRLRPLVAASANPSWANSLGAALMNRGQLLHRLHGVAQATVALAAFDEAAGLLRPLVASTELRSPDSDPRPSPWPRRNLAGVLLNRANLLLDLGRLTEAHPGTAEALSLSLPHERADLVDADLALKTRRARCDALGRLIAEPGADQELLARETSDLVDDGLALARHWTKLGVAEPRELALRLFRFGTQLYRFHQPHFLAEFIRENLAISDPEIRTIALEAIDATLADRPAEYLTVGDPASERRLETWRELAALRTSLAA